MEILTLLKANIRRKKGTFVSMVLLTLIIAVSAVTILSIKESSLKGITKAHEICGTPDVTCIYKPENVTDELIEKLRSDSRVERVDIIDGFMIGTSSMNGIDAQFTISAFKAYKDIYLLDDDLRTIIRNAPKPGKGEIYVPQGILTQCKGKTGDRISINTLAGQREFVVKGILLEPVYGSAMIGIKNVIVSDEDYAEISAGIAEKNAERKTEEDPEENAENNKDDLGTLKMLEVYRSADCKLSSAQFRRQLNLDTGFTDMSIFSMSQDLSVYYTSLYPDIISSILIVFIILLLFIVLIVMVHSISVDIETNYVTFGVLKAQGFTHGKILLLFLGQYLLSEIVGAVLGTIISIPLIGLTSNIFVKINAVPAAFSVPVLSIAAILAGLFVLSGVAICIVSLKFRRISPVRAISGAKKEIYFDSRLNAPISKKLLSPSLALRQFTSAKRRYISTFVIVAILVFFMMIITALANTANSRSALESMGGEWADVYIVPVEDVMLTDQQFEDIENEIERFAKIEKKYYTINDNFSFDGEEMLGCIYKDTRSKTMLKGRSPVYDNEIAVSPTLLDEFDMKLGDEVLIGCKGKKKTCIITGTYQTTYDSGRCFMMPCAAADGLIDNLWLFGEYTLNEDDLGKRDDIVNALNEKFGDIINADKGDESLIDDTIEIALIAIQAIIYVFSVLFSLIVVHMVCSKAFVQERIDIGIYKAVGFDTAGLRRQFAFRFLIAAIIGSVAGIGAGAMLSGKLLSVLLRGIGLTSFSIDITFITIAMPVGVVCISFLVFAYLSSRKIRKVNVRELIAA